MCKLINYTCPVCRYAVSWSVIDKEAFSNLMCYSFSFKFLFRESRYPCQYIKDSQRGSKTVIFKKKTCTFCQPNLTFTVSQTLCILLFTDRSS